MIQLVSAQAFIKWMQPHIVGQSQDFWGYIMGATGQICTASMIKQYQGTGNYAYAQKWLNAKCRVFDCNGLAEGYYRDMTKVTINTYARVNYSTWCAGYNGSTMPQMPQLPGTAIFLHSASAGYITHVGFLEKKTGPNWDDWDVLEARGVKYGLVRTKFKGRGWNRWGLMKKYFDYESGGLAPDGIYELGDRVLKLGMNGNDVMELQKGLMDLGYALPKYGADSAYGEETEAAVRQFQYHADLPITGVYDKATHNRFVDAHADLDAETNDPPSPEDLFGKRILKYTPGKPLMTGEDVVNVQLKLRDLSFTKNNPNGQYGATTEKIVKDFQKSRKIKSDGEVGPLTKIELAK